MNSNLTNLLFDSAIDFPIAFASWKLYGDEVFVSNRLRQILKVGSNILEPYDFVKNMQKTFGSFLNIAVEKISQSDFYGNYYSSVINILGLEYSLKLSINREKQVYLFTLDSKAEKPQENKDLEAILDSIPIYIWQKDKNLKITYCNKPYADALESTKENVIKNNIKLIPQSKNSVYVDHSLYLTKPKKLTEHVIINGSRRLVSIEESPFLDKDKSTGIAFDITEREELEKDYKNYKKQTEYALDNISIPIAIFDKDTTLVFANQALIKLFSIEKLDTYENCKFADIVDYILSNNSILEAENISKYKNLFQTIIEPYHATFQLSNGKVLNVTITPNDSGGLIFIFEDVSDKITLEREVKSISSIQNETLKYLSEGIIIFGADNKIKLTNQIVNNLLDIPEQQTSQNISILDFFKSAKKLFNSKIELETWISKLVNFVSNRMEFSDVLTLTTGQSINYNYTPLPEGLNLVRFLDVTDSVNLGKIKIEKSELIKKINTIKSDLLSNIAYELKVPLQSALGFVEILLNQYFGELNEKQLEYCRGIAESMGKITEIMDAIIDFASLESGHLKLQFTETNLQKFINDLITLFSDNHENLKLKTDFEDKSFNVFIDEQAMKKACYQILSKVLRDTQKEDITISVNRSQEMPDYFSLIIKYNGLTLNKTEIEAINNTLLNDEKDSISDSIDFGLVFANKIIRLHNGKITISAKAEETMVSCSIPTKQFLQGS